MSTAALFTKAKTWKQPKCPPIDEWIKKWWYIYIMEQCTAEKKEGIPTFCDSMDGTRDIMLSEISQSMKDKYHMISFIRGT